MRVKDLSSSVSKLRRVIYDQNGSSIQILRIKSRDLFLWCTNLYKHKIHDAITISRPFPGRLIQHFLEAPTNHMMSYIDIYRVDKLCSRYWPGRAAAWQVSAQTSRQTRATRAFMAAVLSAGSGGCRRCPGELCPPAPPPALRSTQRHRGGASTVTSAQQPRIAPQLCRWDRLWHPSSDVTVLISGMSWNMAGCSFPHISC